MATKKTESKKEMVEKALKKTKESDLSFEEALPTGKPVDRNSERYIHLGIPGADSLIPTGIPKKSNVLLSGGAGCGKTIFGLQLLMHHAEQGKKCLYMSFEEPVEKLVEHLKDFGFDPDKYMKRGNLKIRKFKALDVGKRVGAMLAREGAEIPLELAPLILGENFEPEVIVVDSLSALSAAFPTTGDYFRIYLQQLFGFFEAFSSTTFLISEAISHDKQSRTGIEEFLADGVISLYYLERENVRERAIEILKMRGVAHEKRIVAMKIGKTGMRVYPEQEVFSNL